MRKFTLMLAAAVAMVALTSCSNSTDNEHSRSVVEFMSTNDGGVFVIAMLDAGPDKEVGTGDEFVPAGHVPITLRNRSYNQFIDAPDLAPYGSFEVTHVQVRWVSATSPADLAALAPYNYQADMAFTVPKDGTATVAVVLSSFGMKSSPYFAGLVDGSTLPFVASARVTFTGHDSGSADEVDIVGDVVCEFIGVVVGS